MKNGSFTAGFALSFSPQFSLSEIFNLPRGSERLTYSFMYQCECEAEHKRMRFSKLKSLRVYINEHKTDKADLMFANVLQHIQL